MAAVQARRRIFLCKWPAPGHEVTMVYAEDKDEVQEVLQNKCHLCQVPIDQVIIDELDKRFRLEFRLKTPNRINANSAISKIRDELRNCELLLHLAAANDQISAGPGVGLELQSMQAHDIYGEEGVGQAGWAVQTAIARRFLPELYEALDNYRRVEQGSAEDDLPQATRRLYREIAPYIPPDNTAAAVVAADGDAGHGGGGDADGADDGDDDKNDGSDARSTARSPDARREALVGSSCTSSPDDKTPAATRHGDPFPDRTPTSKPPGSTRPGSSRPRAADTSGGKAVGSSTGSTGASSAVKPSRLETQLEEAVEPRAARATSTGKSISTSSLASKVRAQIDLTGDSDEEVNLVSDSDDEHAAASSSGGVKGKGGPKRAPSVQATKSGGNGSSGPATRSRSAGAPAKKPL